MKFEDNVLFHYMLPLLVMPQHIPNMIFMDAFENGYLNEFSVNRQFFHDFTLSGLWFMKRYEKKCYTTGFDYKGKTLYSLNQFRDYYYLLIDLDKLNG